MAPHWQGPSLLACTRSPGPSVTISPTRISTPSQTGAGPIAERRCHEEHVRWHRDKGDPREVLVAGRQAQVLQCDLGQPRAKLATTGQKQVEEAVLAQRRLKFVQFAK